MGCLNNAKRAKQIEQFLFDDISGIEDSDVADAIKEAREHAPALFTALTKAIGLASRTRTAPSAGVQLTVPMEEGVEAS